MAAYVCSRSVKDGRADVEAIDRLLFLAMCPKDYLVVSGDGRSCNLPVSSPLALLV